MSTMTARQKFADEKRPAVEAALDLVEGVRFKGVSQDSAKTLFPATLLQAGVDEDYRDCAFAFSDDEVKDVVWPIKGSMITTREESGNKQNNIAAVRTIDVRAARGKITKPMPRMVEYVHTAWRDGNRRGFGMSQIYGWFPGGKPQNISTSKITEADTQARNIITCLAGFQMTWEDYWTVVIGSVGGGSSLRVPCSAKAAMDFLSLRDIPEGRTRRSAIRHWVSAHDRKTESGETEVIGHLRGRQKFSWDGLVGYVEPSKAVLDAAKNQKKEK